MSSEILTVNEAVKEFGHQSHTIRRWIRAGKVKAGKTGSEYQINRDSLMSHLDRAKGDKIDTGENPVSVAEVPNTSQQGGEIIAPSSGEVHAPGDTGSGAEAIATPSPQRGSKPPLANAKGRPAQGKAPERKRHLPKACRNPKKFRKGPVRYAKNVMRKFDVAQMCDVRNWLLHRLDVKLKLA